MKPKRSELCPAMGLVTQDLATFLGGQAEVTMILKKCLYVAEIDRAIVDGNLLRMGFPLVFKGDGYPPFPRRWIRDESRNSCILDLRNYVVADIGPGMEGGGNRWFLQSADRSDSGILYPANGRKFDSARIQELLAEPARKFPSPTGIKFFVD